MSTQTNLLPNEIYALQCLERYRKDDVVVDKHNGEFCHCPIPKCLGGTKGYYLTHYDHMIQGLIQSKDMDHCCFYNGDTKKVLNSNFFPHYDWFSLWDIYNKYCGHGSSFIKDHSSGGKQTYRKGVGLFKMTPEEKRKVCRKGGLKGGLSKKPGNGKVTNSQKWISLKDCYVSTSSGVTTHNEHRGWDGKQRVLSDTLECPPHMYSTSVLLHRDS